MHLRSNAGAGPDRPDSRVGSSFAIAANRSEANVTVPREELIAILPAALTRRRWQPHEAQIIPAYQILLREE